MTLKITFDIIETAKEPWLVEEITFKNHQYFQAFAVLTGGQKITGRMRVRHDQAVMDAMDLNFSWNMGRAHELIKVKDGYYKTP